MNENVCLYGYISRTVHHYDLKKHKMCETCNQQTYNYYSVVSNYTQLGIFFRKVQLTYKLAHKTNLVVNKFGKSIVFYIFSVCIFNRNSGW